MPRGVLPPLVVDRAEVVVGVRLSGIPQEDLVAAVYCGVERARDVLADAAGEECLGRFRATSAPLLASFGPLLNQKAPPTRITGIAARRSWLQAGSLLRVIVVITEWLPRNSMSPDASRRGTYI